MKTLKKIIVLLCGLTFLALISACEEQGTMESAGEKMDEAIEQTQEKMEEAGDAMKEQVEQAGEKMEETGEKMQESSQ